LTKINKKSCEKRRAFFPEVLIFVKDSNFFLWNKKESGSSLIENSFPLSMLEKSESGDL